MCPDTAGGRQRCVAFLCGPGWGRGLHCRGVTGARAGGLLATLKHNMEKLITQYKIPTLPRTNNKNFIHSWEISLRSDLETTFLKFYV